MSLYKCDCLSGTVADNTIKSEKKLNLLFLALVCGNVSWQPVTCGLVRWHLIVSMLGFSQCSQTSFIWHIYNVGENV